MTYDKARFEAAHARLREAPLELTDEDLAQLATVDPKFDTEGREARKRAQLAFVQKNMPAGKIKQMPVAAPRALTAKHLEVFADQFGNVLIGVLKQTVLPLREQVRVLEARLAQVESRPMLKYAGVWQSEATYQEGRLTTHQGGLWLATTTTTGMPGTEGSGWRLIVKRGHA